MKKKGKITEVLSRLVIISNGIFEISFLCRTNVVTEMAISTVSALTQVTKIRKIKISLHNIKSSRWVKDYRSSAFEPFTLPGLSLL